jgi:hypothetical protein
VRKYPQDSTFPEKKSSMKVCRKISAVVLDPMGVSDKKSKTVSLIQAGALPNLVKIRSFVWPQLGTGT